MDAKAHLAKLACMRKLYTCQVTGIVNITDPQAYAAKKCGSTADNPTSIMLSIGQMLRNTSKQ